MILLYHVVFSQDFARSSIIDIQLGSEYVSLWEFRQKVSNWTSFTIFAKSFILDVWQGFEHASEVSGFVLALSLWIVTWTGKCQKKFL